MSSRKQLLKEHAKEILKVQRSFIEDLIEQRRVQRMSQSDVAELMGITQSAVSLFEHYDSNPTLSSIRRYALAVNADLVMEVKPRHIYTTQALAPKTTVRRVPKTHQDNVPWELRTLENA